MYEALSRRSRTTLDIVHAKGGPPITQRTWGLDFLHHAGYPRCVIRAQFDDISSPCNCFRDAEGLRLTGDFEVSAINVEIPLVKAMPVFIQRFVGGMCRDDKAAGLRNLNHLSNGGHRVVAMVERVLCMSNVECISSELFVKFLGLAFLRPKWGQTFRKWKLIVKVGKSINRNKVDESAF